MTENVIIIGGGPAGLAASIYLARANLRPLVIAGSPPGGQLTLTSEVENYPGFESILGPELIEKFRSHAKKFGVRIIDENVTEVDFSKRPFQINTSDETHGSYETQTVLIATGAKALWLGLPSETRLRGRGVSACATCDGFFFKNKVVAVVGGGDTAMEEALTLTNFAKHVIIVHRRGEFRASKIMSERVLKHPKIEVIWNTEVTDVLGENKVEGVRLMSVDESSEKFSSRLNSSPPTGGSSNTKSRKNFPASSFKDIKIDGIFIAIGHKPDTDLFKGKIELDKKGYILTTDRVALDNLNIENSLKIDNLKLKIPKFDPHYQSQTSFKGVFAAGDCVDYQYRQAATAVGMGVAAALDVERYLSL